MAHSIGAWCSRALVAVVALAGAAASAQDSESSALGFERTPPRLSFTDGEVSYWQPGASDWAAARVNTPLAVGDELSTGAGANLELQVGARAYVRAGETTQLGLSSLEPDYLQLKLTNGTAALDLREIDAGRTLEIDTPNAAFTIERPGFYRVQVADGATTFITRRGGRASVTTSAGLPSEIGANEQVVVTGGEAPVLATYGAPALDDWDRWNYSRSEQQANPASARYVPAGVYGAEDLDAAGTWRTVPTYGAVWVPRVAVGWTPYSAGRWIADPYYGWTWVDDAPWGWAPFHYGRWVYVSSYWAWTPGPVVVRPYYSPALVAFYGNSNFSVSVGIGAPYTGWVALGWGEPVVPWWGPRGCRGVPRWAGWGGPRVVNNVVVNNNYDSNYISSYQHADRHGALVAVDRSRFGRGNVREARVARFDASRLSPVRGGDMGVRPDRRTRVSEDLRGAAPARDLVDRRVVTRGGDAARARTREARQEQTRMRRALDQTSGRGPRAAPGAPSPRRVAQADRTERRRSVSESAVERQSVRERAVAPAAARSTESRRQRGQERAPRRERAGEAPVSARPRGSEPRASRGAPAQARATADPRSAARRAPRSATSDERRSQPRAAPVAPRPRNESASQRAPRAEPRSQRRAEPRSEPRAQPRAEPRAQRQNQRPAPGGANPAPRSRDGNSRDGGGRRDDGSGPRSRRG